VGNKLLFLFLFCSCLSYAQSKNERIKLSVEDASLESIFDSLSVKTGYFFSYNSDLLPTGDKFTISAESLSIDEFLSMLLVGTNLQYSFFKEQIIINYEIPKTEVKRRKRFNISGTVTDENGEPLYGVNVFLDGTTIGASTDQDGNYRIDNVSLGFYNLVFSFIGYENAVYNLAEHNGGERTQKHKMIPSVNELKEVEIVSERVTTEYDEWKTYYQLFRNDLFGSSETSEFCEITNPHVIDFTYDQINRILTAEASEPLKIINEAMAYQITYYLESFERSDTDLRYRGQIKFQNDPESSDLTTREIKSQRRKNYLGSWNHFKKSLLSNRLRKDGFKVFETKRLSDIDIEKLEAKSEGEIIVFKGNHWELDFNDYLLVVYSKEKESINFLIDGEQARVIYGDYIDENMVVNRTPSKQMSLLKLLHGSVRLDLNGQVVDKFGITTFGYWSWERLANLVPINYDPKLDDFKK
jgi:hypothetical protein